MTNILQLTGGKVNGTVKAVDFTDQSKYEYFVFLDPPTPNYDRSLTALGCGNSPGATASLTRDRYLYVGRKYRIGCWDGGKSVLSGASFELVDQHAKEVENQILSASLYNSDPVGRPTESPLDDPDTSVTGHPVWIVRKIQDQAKPEVWTVLTGTRGKAGRIHEERYGIPRIVLELEFLCMEGAVMKNGSGFPMDGVVVAPILASQSFGSMQTQAVADAQNGSNSLGA